MCSKTVSFGNYTNNTYEWCNSDYTQKGCSNILCEDCGLGSCFQDNSVFTAGYPFPPHLPKAGFLKVRTVQPFSVRCT